MSRVRRIEPGSAHLNADCPIYDKTWKNVIINAKQGDHITVLDSGTEDALRKIRWEFQRILFSISQKKPASDGRFFITKKRN